MQFQVVDIVVQVSGSLMDLRVRVPLLKTSIGYVRGSDGRVRLNKKNFTFEANELPEFV